MNLLTISTSASFEGLMGLAQMFLEFPSPVSSTGYREK